MGVQTEINYRTQTRSATFGEAVVYQAAQRAVLSSMNVFEYILLEVHDRCPRRNFDFFLWADFVPCGIVMIDDPE